MGLFDFLKKPNVEELKAKGDINGLIKALRSQDMSAPTIKTLIGIGEQGVEALINSLRDRDSKIRASAATAFEIIKDVRAIEPLIDLLKDSSSDVRYSAAWSLCIIGDKNGIKRSIPILEELYIRTASIAGPDSVGNEIRKIYPGADTVNLLESLCAHLKNNSNPFIRAKSALVLSKLIKSQEHSNKLALIILAGDSLTVSLFDKDRDVRVASAIALTEIYDKQRIENSLRELLEKEKDKAVKNVIEVILEEGFSGKEFADFI